MEGGVHLAAPVVFTVAGLPITNTLIAAWLAMAVLIVLSLLATRRMQLVPSGLQNVAELIVETLLGICQNTAGERRGRRFLPIVATLFLFIWTANWMGILPGYGEGEIFVNRSAEPHGSAAAAHGLAGGKTASLAGAAGASAAKAEPVAHVDLLRSANSDLNITLAMAAVVFLLVELSGFRAAGLAYLREFVWPGLLIEIISHIARPVALALRLFGNILAGEVLLTTMKGLVPLVVPTLFMAFELFVGIVQALIFSLLTLAFLTLATEHEAHAAHGEHAESAAH